MAAEDKWYCTKEELANTPSRKCGFDGDKELSSRQQAANFIQDMGQRLLVTQLCINTAIVYMHRFYLHHSFTRFHRNAMAAAALFLAAKVEEQPRKLEHVIKVAQVCLHREQPPLDVKSEAYMEQAQELVVNENILLQTLGFDVAIDHPHTHVVRCCHLVRASKDLAQTSYFMASNSLHLTTMCLQYKPTVVACFCIHLACKWSNWEIPQSNEGRPWFWYVDKSVTQELLEQLTEEFLVIFEKCPSRLKKKIMSLSSSSQHSSILSAFNTPEQDKKRNGEGTSSAHQNSVPYQGSGPSGLGSSSSANMSSGEDMKRKMDYSQRHHADYKKPHVSSHHSRNENVANMAVKSSCMFGPPQRTQPPQTHAPGVVASTGSGNNMRTSHKPPLPQDQRPRRPEHHPQTYKKEQQHYFPQQPPTVEVPKPTTIPPVPKVERSIFSPEVSTTPEPKPEPILRIKEERVEEPPPPPPPPPPVVPPAPLPVIKEEKVEIKQELLEVKPHTETALPPPVEDQHKEVKKKKKKHKEHKEKHKDKHKHKKEKHKEPGPIVITIPKDKLTTVPPVKEQSLKIKIAKDKITPITPVQQTSPVKLKIPKEKLKDSRKRERSESPGAATGTKRPNGAVQVGLDGGGRH
ncbi:cyclin-T2 [Halyomorpha halys]|uniref:cyclin-T2 n=1 Tax=Halyomorpha halys TaxID=286706 RepID=UPI0006D521A5